MLYTISNVLFIGKGCVFSWGHHLELHRKVSLSIGLFAMACGTASNYSEVSLLLSLAIDIQL